MGLIKAGMGALGGTLADQWKEFFYCESMPKEVLVTKGQKRTTGRSSNTKGNDNIIRKTSFDSKTYENYDNVYQTYYKFDVNKPVVTKFTLKEAGQWNGNSIQAIDVAWLGYGLLTITPEMPQTESIKLHGKMRIKYELLTEDEYNAEKAG